MSGTPIKRPDFSKPFLERLIFYFFNLLIYVSLNSHWTRLIREKSRSEFVLGNEELNSKNDLYFWRYRRSRELSVIAHFSIKEFSESTLDGNSSD